ncbi:charged multivesicular body protein 7 isoform X2 [Protopterus annectens]|uniref:charged multivesicular body protein 7 isoform X2 n=1 Tax=Protopterus annectens TaxID=7888 RepID=UPI001CF96C23|nr:charged multivesicular body protein 7 isoform X2 [Protopterus annectens]
MLSQEFSEMTFPREWDDDERMAVLFSAFKQNRDVNPLDWDSKMKFWTPLILDVAKQKGVVWVTLNELKETFRRKGSIPLGLGTVLESMIRQGALRCESDFVTSVESGWISWGLDLLLVKPLKWTFSTMMGSSGVQPEDSFVVKQLIKEKADEVYHLFQDSSLSTHPVVPFSELQSLCNTTCQDEKTFKLAMLQLQAEKRAAVLDYKGEKIVKFTRTPKAKVASLNDVDIGVYQLMKSEKLLSERMELLSKEAERCKEEARCHVKNGKQKLALRSLKAKKRAEKQIDGFHLKLDTIQAILDRIYSAQTDTTVTDAYQAGLDALKLAMKDVTVEKTENLMDQIQEMCDTQEDINRTLASLGTELSGDTDMDELEQELDYILENAEMQPVDLPEVPIKPLPSEPLPALPDLPESLPELPSDSTKEKNKYALEEGYHG